MQCKTTIIIPNFNGLHFLKPCIESLEKQTVREFQILVVDNGSTDGSEKWLREQNIDALLLKENTGFSGAVNAGIRAARTPYVILLNNDITVDARFVYELERAMDQSERIFSVSSKMIQMYHPGLMDDAGDMYSIFGWAYQRGVGRPVEKYNRPCRIFSACAGAAIFRKSVFDLIGVFDPMHFAYLEDIDVGYRAKLSGYENLYCPKAMAYHVGSGTSASGSRYNSFKVRLAARNNIYLAYKNMPALQILLNLPFLAAGILVKYLFFVRRGFGRDYLDGLFEGFRTAKSCRKVPVEARRLGIYVKIQLEMIFGTFLYIYEFLSRQYRKAFPEKNIES